MLTLFSIPKAFRGHMEVIQRNAIQSWTLLRPRVEIILLGDEHGTERVAKTLALRHVPGIARNDYGTPLLDDVLRQASRVSTQETLCYVNADIVLMDNLLGAVESVRRRKESFLVVGQRWDIDLREPFDFSSGWETRLRASVAAQGRLHPPTGMDYFVFSRGLWGDVPPFAIGRTVWDNWLVYRARARHASVVDATERVTAVHQDHDYSHLSAGAGDVWKGPEAADNLRLAGGWDHVFTLQDATHTLTPYGLRIARSRKHIERHLETIPRLYPYLTPLIKLVRGVLHVSRIGRRVFQNHPGKGMVDGL